MVQFIFVRHGESTSNEHLHTLEPGETLGEAAQHAVRTHANPSLTRRGRGQASATADHLACVLMPLDPGVVGVLASPFSRAVGTADEYRAALITDCLAAWSICSAEAESDAAGARPPPLQLSKGDPTSMYRILNDLREYTTDAKWSAMSEKERAYGAADTWPTFTQRVAGTAEWLEREFADAGDDAVVLVYGHSIHISTLLTHVATQRVYMPPTIDALAIELPNCSLSVAHYRTAAPEGTRWRVYKTACACHLGAAATGRHTVV